MTTDIFEYGVHASVPLTHTDSYLVFFTYITSDGFEQREAKRFYANGKDKHVAVSDFFKKKNPKANIWKVVYE